MAVVWFNGVLMKSAGVAVARKPTRRRPDKGDGGRRAYAELRRRIVSLELRPGADIDEATLVRDLGVSRTPVRGALLQLAGEGLVVLLPNSVPGTLGDYAGHAVDTG